MMFALAGTAIISTQAYAQSASPPPLDAYGDLPNIEDVAISDSGQNIAIFGRIQGGPRKIVIASPDKTVRRVIGADDTKFRGFRFVGDDSLLLYRSTTVDAKGYAADKYELTQAIVVPVDAGIAPQAIFADNRKLNNAIFGAYGVRRKADGNKAYYGALENDSGNLVNSQRQIKHGRPYLYEVDLRTMDTRRIASAPPEGTERQWEVDRNGEVAATLDINSSGKWSITNSAGKEIASGKDPRARVGLVGFGEDGSSLIYSAYPEGGEENEWFEIPLAGGTATPFLKDVDIKRAYWNSQTGEFLGYMEDNEDQTIVTSVPTLKKNIAMARKPFVKYHPRIMDWTPDYSKMIVRTAGGGDSGTWFLVDLAGKSADAIGYERPNITPDKVGTTSTVSYTAKDGLEMDGILTIPPGKDAKNLPVVVLPHGGPHTHDDESFDWWAQAFASRGYAVFQPNFRGSTGRDSSFEKAGYGEWGGKMQTDISDGLKKLVDDGIVDPKRACIMGASYGGYAALAGVTLQNGLYRCAVSVAGVSDVSLMFRTDVRESGDDKSLRLNLLDELGPKDNWKAISPRKQADKADAPILLIHGKDDTVVAYDQSTKMADALKDAGKPYEMVTLDGEDHWLSQPETRKNMLRAAMAFVQKHNPAN